MTDIEPVRNEYDCETSVTGVSSITGTVVGIRVDSGTGIVVALGACSITGAVVGIAVGLATGMAVGIAVGLATGMAVEITAGLDTGRAVGIAAGLATGVAVEIAPRLAAGVAVGRKATLLELFSLSFLALGSAWPGEPPEQASKISPIDANNKIVNLKISASIVYL